ncbi:MAG TPA: 6-phosphogluconolactonase [Candidatus Limnocylindria bacterium]
MEMVVLPTPAAVAAEAADGFVTAARHAVRHRGRFLVALSGGRTPHTAFHLLRAAPRVSQVAWEQVEILWSDERAVPPDDPESNYGAARESLLAHLPGLRPEAVHRMPGEAADLDRAARDYEDELRQVADAADDEVPVLDLVWLGMGVDGHTASLCPGDDALMITDRLVVATWPPGYDTPRLTLTYPVLNAARQVTFLVVGAEKADTLAAVRGGADLPAARVRAERVTWLVDAAAAGQPAAQLA